MSVGPKTLDQLRLWQGRETIFSRVLKSFRWLRRPPGLALLGILPLALFCLFIWVLLYAPKRTPLVAIQTAPYEWPFPPNGWVYEDVEDLKFLDGKTLSTFSHRIPKQATSQQALVAIKKHLADGIPEASRAPAAIIYVSMHGIVADGIPYLVPSGAAPHDPSTWLALADLLDTVCAEIPAARKKLVVLDCSRIQVNWHLGVLYNDFTNQVKTWWDANKTRFPSLAILVTAGAGERAWTSPDLQGTVFGHYFRLGLAGEADRHSPMTDNGSPQTDKGSSDVDRRPPTAGNRDRWVSVHELHSYLKYHVNDWVRFNRGESQSPLLLDSMTDGEDFVLARSVTDGTLESLQDEEKNLRRPEPEFGNSLDDLWQSLDRLRNHDTLRPYRAEPLAWRDLEHNLLWLEQLAASGAAYDGLARTTMAKLQNKMQQIKDRVVRLEQNRPLPDCRTVIAGERIVDIEGEMSLHSLPLAEFFGAIDPEIATTFRDPLARFRASPDKQTLEQTLASLEQIPNSGELIPHRFLHMLQRYQSPELWSKSGLLEKLLETRDRGEALAVPLRSSDVFGDERGHYWVRRLLSDADEKRRAAEDHLIIAGQPSLEALLDAAEAAHTGTSNASSEMAAAIQVCDQANAELAYLAEWLTHPLLTRGTQTGTLVSPNALLKEELLPAISATHRLAGEISDHSRLGDDVAVVQSHLGKISDSTKDVETGLDSLRNALVTECKELADPNFSSSVPETRSIRRLEAAALNPILSAKSRRLLRNQSAKLATELNQQFHRRESSRNDATTSVPQSESRSDNAPLMDAYAKWAQKWGRHPLLALAREDDATVAITEANTAWLGHLRDLRKGIRDSAESVRRDDLSTIERRIRAVGPVWFPEPSADPVKRLRQLDLHALVLWHAERSLNDFWGPAGKGFPFFEVATLDYLNSASQILPADESPRAGDLQSRFAVAFQNWQTWLTTTASDTSLLLDVGEDASTQVVVQSEWNADEYAPQGTAALWINRAEKRLRVAQFAPSAAIPLLSEAAPVDVTIDGDELPPTEVTLDATTIFRGHESRTPFKVPRLGGVTVDLEPQEYERSRITLQNPWKKLSVVFVLDCSKSMDKEMEPDQSRWTVAKDALQKLLTRLAAEQNVRIGLRLFGHRVGWSTDRPIRMLTSTSYPGEIAPDVTPSQDVERVLPLADFEFAAAETAFRSLDTVSPWGQSPLYLTLEQALQEEFTAADEDANRHVIVLTDGRDYQFRPWVGERKTVSDVVAAWQEQRVPIHILGLAMDRGERQRAAAEFSEIAQVSGGITEYLETSADVCRMLETILSPPQYRVQDAEGGVVGEASLGRPVQLNRSRQGTDWYSVLFENLEERVILEGGEALEFYYRPGGSTILAYPYTGDLAKNAELFAAADGSRTPYVLRLHRPVRSEQDVRFPVSLQLRDPQLSFGDERFRWTPRPSDLWVEVTPRLSDGEEVGQKYIFYDRDFRPDKPVPFLELTAHEWPADATYAGVLAWFRAQPTSPEFAIPLAAAVGDGGRAPFVMEQLGITLRVDAARIPDSSIPYRVRVVEEHGGQSLLGSIRISPPVGSDVPPARIVRQYDEEHGVAVHSFFYAEDASLIERLKLAEIQVVTGAAFHADSINTGAEEIVVEITEAGNLLPLAGP